MPRLLLALCLWAALSAPAPADAPARSDRLGDRLPEGAVCRLGSARLRATTTVTCLAFTPDGKSLVSAGHGNKLTFWSVATGRAEKEWTLDTHNVLGLQFDKSGKTLAVTCQDGTVRILDGTTGTERRQLADPQQRSNHSSASLSPDGKWLVLGHRYGSQFVILDVSSGSLARRISGIDSQNGPHIAFTPDGKRFVSPWTDGRLHLIEVDTGASVRDLESVSAGPAPNGGTRVAALALSPDGKRLVYRTLSDRLLRVVDVATGTEVRRFERTAGPYYTASGSLSLTPNGRFVVETSGDASVRVWGVASGKLLRELTATNATFAFSTTSPDGKLVAAASDAAIFLWDVASGKRLHGSAGHASILTRLAFSPDGRRVVSVGSGSMRVWDAATGKEQAVTHAGLSGNLTGHLAFAPDGRSLRWVGYDRAVRRWRPDAEREPARLVAPRVDAGSYNAVATSPDGKLFAALTAVDGRVKLADNLGGAPDREVARLPVNSGAVLTFAPDGRTLAVASTFRSLTLCDLDAGQSRKILPDPTKGETHFPLVEFAPDGRSLMLFDGETRVVETITGGDRVFLSREPAGRPGGMAWSADGRLVARGFDDGTAIVTDLWTGRELFRRQTGQGAIHALGLSRDGKRLVTGGMNSTGVVWELDPFGPPRAGPKGYDAWADLEEIDAGRAYRAMLGLIASPGDTPALIAKQFEARPPVEAGRIDRLVADLGADDYKVRERAGRELLDLGPLAAAALKKAARSPSLEVKRRAADLLGRIEPGAGLGPARLRCLRAVEVLERIGTPAARAALEAMRKAKPDASLDAAIRASLARMP